MLAPSINLGKRNCQGPNNKGGLIRPADMNPKSIKNPMLKKDIKTLRKNILKVVGNEKEGGPGKWQMIDIGLGPWWSMSVCLCI